MGPLLLPTSTPPAPTPAHTGIAQPPPTAPPHTLTPYTHPPLLSVPPTEKLGVILGKVAHYTLLLVVPGLRTGWVAALLGAAGYSTSLSILLALMFFVSHNVPGSKPLEEGRDTAAVLYTDMEGRDWGEQQVRQEGAHSRDSFGPWLWERVVDGGWLHTVLIGWTHKAVTGPAKGGKGGRAAPVT